MKNRPGWVPQPGQFLIRGGDRVRYDGRCSRCDRDLGREPPLTLRGDGMYGLELRYCAVCQEEDRAGRPPA